MKIILTIEEDEFGDLNSELVAEDIVLQVGIRFNGTYLLLQVGFLTKLNKMINVKVKFFHHEWDNYQGASGKVLEMEQIITLNDDAKIFDVKNIVVSILNNMGYKDDWNRNDFSGRGLISVSVLQSYL